MTTVVDILGKIIQLAPIHVNGRMRSFQRPKSDDQRRHQVAILEWINMKVLVYDRDAAFFERIVRDAE